MASPASLPPHLLPRNPTPRPSVPITRRSILLLPLCTTATGSAAATGDSPSSSVASPVITDRVFMDFAICPSHLRPDLVSCPDSEPLGRVVFGLYGRRLPLTTAAFRGMCAAAAYRGAVVHKLLPGRYFAAGRQGIRRGKGEVQPLPDLVKNTEVVDSKAFELRHSKPGTLSLCLSENDDDEEITMDPEYRNVEFLVTTGPGPCPELDDGNIVFGTVLEGLDVVTSIAAIPTYKPAERIRQFNEIAEFLGDDRAQIARALWNRPLKTVYIRECGELKVAKPSLSPSLP